MNPILKKQKDLATLYQWVTLTRKKDKTKSIEDDFRLIFSLLNIPLSDTQLKPFIKIFQEQNNKSQLSLQDFINYFVTHQESKKIKQKQITKAFAYVLNSFEKENKLDNQSKDSITFHDIGILFQNQGFDQPVTQMVLKQLRQWENNQGTFNFKQFISSLY